MNTSVGILLVLLSVIGYASILPLLKKVTQTVPIFTAIAVSMFVLFICSLIASVFVEHSAGYKLLLQKNNLMVLIVAGVINTMAFWLALEGAKYLPVWQQSLFSLLVPIVGGIVAYFLLGEQLSYKLLLGLVIMSIGLYIAIR